MNEFITTQDSIESCHYVITSNFDVETFEEADCLYDCSGLNLEEVEYKVEKIMKNKGIRNKIKIKISKLQTKSEWYNE